MHTRRRSIIMLVLCAIGFLPCAAFGTVKVVKGAAVFQTRTFDPTDPPKDMPPLHEGEDAFTNCDFQCAIDCQFRTVDRKPKDNGVEVAVKIYTVTVTTQMHVTIWLPTGASAKLTAHEQGHRQISERIYENAEKAAKDAAKKIDERRVVGHGDSQKSATQSTISTLARDTTDAYLAQTLVKCSRVNEIYDELTAHGTRQQPSEPEAIKLAFEKYVKEKQPATTQAGR